MARFIFVVASVACAITLVGLKGLFKLKFCLPLGSLSMFHSGPSLGNPGVMPFKIANALSAELACPLVVFLVVPTVAHVCPQTGSLAMAGHACTCPLMGLLVAVTQAHPSFFVVAAAASQARAMPHSLPRAPMP